MEGNVYAIFRDLAIILIAAKLCGIFASPYTVMKALKKNRGHLFFKVWLSLDDAI